MGFTDIFIRRPVFATVLSLIILLVGIRSYFSLQVRLFPKVDASVVSVYVNYSGANSALMEGFVTTPIENALGGVDGIDYISSTSSQNTTYISIYFKLGYDINAAVSDVSAKVNSVRYKLPREIDDPVVSKSDPNAFPTMFLSFFSATKPQEQITDYLERVVQPQLQTLPGVASADVAGVGYAMRIWLNPQLMAAHSITPSELYRAITTENLQSPAGQLKTSMQQLQLRTFSEANTAEQFNNLIIKQDNGNLVRLKDIGQAELGPSTTDIAVTVKGKPTDIIKIVASPIANPLDITAAVNKILPEIQRNLPEWLKANVIWDNSKFIAESIHEVKKTIIEATFGVILIVFLFLGSWRTLLIPTVTIPLSLVGVFGVMLAMGYTLNTITYLALVLAIGMVVDDAIVVSENIHRHITAGKSPMEASLIGAREIQFAVVAMTLTLAAVYAPIGFLTGLIGSLFKEFAFTLSSVVIISGFIALTLSPMMCSKILSATTMDGIVAKKIANFSERMQKGYHSLLQKTLQKRLLVLLVIPAVIIACVILYRFIPGELVPSEDGGAIYAIISAPTSANIDYTKKYTRQLIPIYASMPEADTYLTVDGQGFGGQSPNQAFSVLALKPWSQRKLSTDQVIAKILPKMWAISGIQAFPINPPNIPGSGGGMPIQMVFQSTGSYQALNDEVQKVVNAARANPFITNLDTSPKFDQPQLDININRNKAGDLGVSAEEIGTAINFGLGNPTISRFSILGRSYDVIPQIYPEFSNQPDTLNNIYLHTAKNSLVPLSNLIQVKETVTSQSINHFQQLRSVTLQAATTPNYTIGEALQYLQEISKRLLPNDIQISYSGFSRQFFETGNQMLFTFIFAVLFIFLVLAAQFESFRDPFIVLITIPLSTCGALLAILLTGCSLNIYSEIGLVTLVGLISKHGILMVEFANQLQESGKTIREAIITAATVRLRPILMTTSAMVLGAVPLALAKGAGAASRQQIGWTIIGGMLLGTLFTLFIVPTIYTYIATRKGTEIKK